MPSPIASEGGFSHSLICRFFTVIYADSVNSSVGGSEFGVSMGTGMRRIQRKRGPFSDKTRGTAQLYWDMLKEEREDINPQLDVTFALMAGSIGMEPHFDHCFLFPSSRGAVTNTCSGLRGAGLNLPVAP